MSKLATLLIASAFALLSAGAFAASDSGEATDETKMDATHEMQRDAKDECKDLEEGAAKDECMKTKEQHDGMEGEKKEGEKGAY